MSKTQFHIVEFAITILGAVDHPNIFISHARTHHEVCIHGMRNQSRTPIVVALGNMKHDTKNTLGFLAGFD